MPNETNTFKGEIKVASRIVDHLSSGIYKSPAACLKELINNSYDADATTVHVSVKPDADRIIVEDDGTGFSRLEFETHFKRIAESHKRDESDDTARGRPKIGHIGIGFIAANELCNELEIFSTKEGSTELLHITIDFAMMRLPMAERERKGGDVAKADYHGEILNAETQEHYTTLLLKDIRGPARDVLAGAAARRTPGSLYGKSPTAIRCLLGESDLKSWTDLDDYSRTMLRVALNVPVKYAPDWVPKDLLSSGLGQFARTASSLGFTVIYDGTDLRKPIVFHPAGRRTFVKTFEHSGDKVSARGYFYAQHGKIHPADLQGLLVRIRHSAVGEYDQTYWDFPTSEGPVLQTWISAEVWPDDRLEEAMNIDRSTLRDVDPAYVELRDALHSFLSAFLKEVRMVLYGAGAAERKTKRASRELQRIKQVATEQLSDVPAALQNVSDAWHDDRGAPGDAPSLTAKYSVSELYAIVIEVAQDLLPRPLLADFLKRLTHRLRR